jgi:hypothetical protein
VPCERLCEKWCASGGIGLVKQSGSVELEVFVRLPLLEAYKRGPCFCLFISLFYFYGLGPEPFSITRIRC